MNYLNGGTNDTKYMEWSKFWYGEVGSFLLEIRKYSEIYGRHGDGKNKCDWNEYYSIKTQWNK